MHHHNYIDTGDSRVAKSLPRSVLRVSANGDHCSDTEKTNYIDERSVASNVEVASSLSRQVCRCQIFAVRIHEQQWTHVVNEAAPKEFVRGAAQLLEQLPKTSAAHLVEKTRTTSSA
jgi:hypothetical protein